MAEKLRPQGGSSKLFVRRSLSFPLSTLWHRGSPSREVLARLESAGVRIFWTGRDGAVIIETDGKNLSIKTGRKAPLSGAPAH